MESTIRTRLENRLSAHDNERQIHGGQSGALLDMLAEVATQTLEFDSNVTSRRKQQKKETCRGVDAITHLLSLSAKRLIEMFTRFDGDEIRRTFTFTCMFDTDHCKQSFFSFGSESKALQLMKSHLLVHVQQTEQQAARGLPVMVKKQSQKTCRKRVAKAQCNITKRSKPNQTKRKYIPSLEKREVSEYESRKTNGATLPSPPSSPPAIDDEPDSVAHPVNQHLYMNLSDEVTVKMMEVKEICEDMSQELEKVESDNIDRFMLGEANGNPAVAAYLDCDELQLMQLPHVGQEVSVNTTLAVSPIKEENVPKIDDVRNLLPAVCDNKIVSSDSFKMNDLMHSKKSREKTNFIGQSKSEKDEALRLIEEAKRKGSSGVCLTCHICCPSRHFTALTTLISHYRSHAGIKPFECVICGHAFTRQHSLNYHLLIHSNMTRFTCTDCGRKFRHPSHFREHQRRHTGESPYECQDCAFRFKTRNTFKRHMKTRHGKVLTTSGSVVVLSREEFSKVRTLPRTSNTTDQELRSVPISPLDAHETQEMIFAKQEVDKENDKSDFSSNMNINISKLSFVAKSNNSSINTLCDIISDAMTQSDIPVLVGSHSNDVSNDDNNNQSALLTVPYEESVVTHVDTYSM